MSEQTSKTVIGGFIVGAIALAVIGALIFGSGKFMKKTNKYILYFEGSVRGLNVGSSVAFRGVKVGSVIDVILRVDPKDMTMHIPVIIEIDPERVEVVGSVRAGDPRSNMRKLIERGVRAQLKSESLVTGQLMVEFDYHPEIEVRLVGADKRYLEIPTIPSTFEEMTKKIMELPIESLFEKLVATIEALNKIVASPEIIQTVHTLKLGMEDARALVNGLNSQVEPLAANLNSTLGDYARLARDTNDQIKPFVSDVRDAVEDYGKLARNADQQVGTLAKNVGETLKVAISTLGRAENTIHDLAKEFSKDSAITTELKTALRELASASRSIRIWADYLERHPEALIAGKGEYRR